VTVLAPSDFATLPCPGYREIRLALPKMAFIAEHVLQSGIDHVHIATEGPIGWATRSICLRHGVRFTTSFHTRFPEYLHAYIGLPVRIGYAVQRRFHASAVGTFVATPSLKTELARCGFERLMLWTRGVDTAQFCPRPEKKRNGEAPIFLYVGRISREKNVEAFLDLDLPGRKVVVGDGPLLPALRKCYRDADFRGAKIGEALAAEYAAADVFVFPSRTDTFGLVMLEAMASGLPIAAYPVMGPVDVVMPGVTGILSDNLQAAALAALSLDPAAIRAQAMRYDWSRVASMFLENIYEARRGVRSFKSVAADKSQSRPIKPNPKPVA
jgi:glycosyltransferase involved in cell wall biosynthesis